MARKSTERTLDHCKKQGMLAQSVEKRLPRINVTVDLFNLIDVIALDDQGILGIQACWVSDLAEHRKKAYAEENREKLLDWLMDARLEIWAWKKRPLRRGAKAMRWTVTREPITVGRLP